MTVFVVRDSAGHLHGIFSTHKLAEVQVKNLEDTMGTKYWIAEIEVDYYTH